MPPATGVKIELGGKVRTLRYTMPALERLEDDRRGETVAETLTKAAQLSARAIAALVWAGLLHEEPKLERDAVGSLIEPPFEPTLEAITEALRPWLRAGAEDDAGKAPAGD
jgi:hypothetical protein